VTASRGTALLTILAPVLAPRPKLIHLLWGATAQMMMPTALLTTAQTVCALLLAHLLVLLMPMTASVTTTPSALQAIVTLTRVFAQVPAL